KNWDFTQGYRRERSDYETSRTLSLYTFGPPLELGANPTVRSSSNFKNRRRMKNDAYELGVNYRYSDTGNIYTRGEFGFRTPAPSELIDKSQDKTVGYLENNLEPEKFRNFEIGIKDAYKNMFFTLTAFHTRTEDEILQIGSMPTWWEFINMGKTERTGIELSSEQYFGKLTLSQGFTLVEAEIKSGEYAGNYIPGVSKYSLNIKGTYDITEKLSGTLSGTWKDGYYLNQDNKSGKVNNYLVTDLNINYQFNRELKIYAGITNLFNEKYYNSVSESSKSRDGKVYDPAAERRFYTGFDYKF
ncbi:MAG: TonB-dependent receptor, partial [Fusobacteriaceae bacterium]